MNASLPAVLLSIVTVQAHAGDDLSDRLEQQMVDFFVEKCVANSAKGHGLNPADFGVSLAAEEEFSDDDGLLRSREIFVPAPEYFKIALDRTNRIATACSLEFRSAEPAAVWKKLEDSLNQRSLASGGLVVGPDGPEFDVAALSVAVRETGASDPKSIILSSALREQR